MSWRFKKEPIESRVCKHTKPLYELEARRSGYVRSLENGTAPRATTTTRLSGRIVEDFYKLLDVTTDSDAIKAAARPVVPRIRESDLEDLMFEIAA